MNQNYPEWTETIYRKYMPNQAADWQNFPKLSECFGKVWKQSFMKTANVFELTTDQYTGQSKILCQFLRHCSDSLTFKPTRQWLNTPRSLSGIPMHWDWVKRVSNAIPVKSDNQNKYRQTKDQTKDFIFICEVEGSNASEVFTRGLQWRCREHYFLCCPLIPALGE